ncbi:prolyl oligopeptidase family serine peptidase [Caulobacter soli]|uniref:prolyl oligopeptidase family serine peptidase n=1 Tax=Caulobacter soli TaxID=2708539 RepID=UPI0013EB9003|nr:prolyl oligopeptidase family serine peptidase [Caulobacter soli]
MTRIDYPSTRTTSATDERCGVVFQDPYHWLEEDTQEVRDWQRAQATLASDHVRAWPHYDALKQSVGRYLGSRFGAPPREANGLWFRTEAPAGTTQACVLVADTLLGEGRIVFDPRWENPQSPPFVSWIAPSPDGKVLAVGVCADGSENNTIRLIDVDTATLRGDAPTELLMDSWLGGVQWLGDSSGFYFTGLTGPKHAFRQQVFLHRLGAAAAEPIQVPLPADSQEYRGVTVSRCGRWAVLHYRLGSPAPAALLDLSDPSGGWRPFVSKLEGTVAGLVVGDRYIAATDVGAARGRVVAIPLDSPTPNDPATWEVLVPESESVVRSLKLVGEHLYVNEFVDTYARVSIVTLDGAPVGQVPLPGKGAISELPFLIMHVFGVTASDQFLFGFSTLTSAWGVYLHKPGADHVETVKAPDVTIENAVIEDHWAISADGSRVPYHTVRLASVDVTKPQPTLIYAYGGFNAPWLPQFPGPMAAFVAAGGVYVHGHLRGGGELGLDWWRGGSLKNKHNGYLDLYAIAEDLIASDRTTPQLLGVTGGSNGGLLAGVAITQRPHLWRVAIPRVPLFDVIGAMRDAYGRYVIAFEFGDPDDADEVRRMASFSPYHLVKKGVTYPAVFIDAGDTDPRCPPWHARKFAARLQAAQGGDAPILVHIWENVGHGWATPKDIQIEENTEWLAFAMQCLGLTPPAP